MNHAVKMMSLWAVAFLVAGCIGVDGPADTQAPIDRPELSSEADHLAAMSVKAADEADSETAVESALIWAEKYDKAIEKLIKAQREWRQLDETSRLQRAELQSAKQQLKQAQKELSDANAMLIEMQAEMEKWKADVLGFRDEMRKAQETQLIALRMVLKLLGGEISDDLQAASNESSKGVTQ